MFDKIEDTEAFVVANDDMILVVFRGTSETKDWLTNLKFATRRVPPEWGLDGEGCDIHEVRTHRTYCSAPTRLENGNVPQYLTVKHSSITEGGVKYTYIVFF